MTRKAKIDGSFPVGAEAVVGTSLPAALLACAVALTKTLLAHGREPGRVVVTVYPLENPDV